MLLCPATSQAKTASSPGTETSKVPPPSQKNGTMSPRQIVVSLHSTSPSVNKSISNTLHPAVLHERISCQDNVDDETGVNAATNIGNTEVGATGGEDLEKEIEKDYAKRDSVNPGVIDLCPGEFSMHSWLASMEVLLRDFIGQKFGSDDSSKDVVEKKLIEIVAKYRDTNKLMDLLVPLERFLIGQNNLTNYMKYLTMIGFDRRRSI